MRKYNPYRIPAALKPDKKEIESTDPVAENQQTEKEKSEENIQQVNLDNQVIKMATINIDPLKLVKNLPNFNGKTCNIIVFIKKVDFIISVVSLYNETAKEFIINEIKAKLTDNALEVVLRGGDPNNWQEIKNVLINNFGEKESFLKLKELADKVYTKNITHLYNSYAEILCRLNNKYYLSEDKPIEYNSSNNEASLLAKFCEKIPPNASSIIINHGIRTLSEAFYKLESCHWTKEGNDNNYGKNIQNQRNENYTNNSRNYNYRNNNQNQNFNRNNNQNQNFNNQNKNNYQNRNQQYNGQPNRSGNFSNQNRNPFATQRNIPEPMEVDHLTQNTANFQIHASTDHYPA